MAVRASAASDPGIEWRDIAAGVAQRAELLDQILHDVYGEARLVAEGALPAAAITGSPDFIRPMCGVAPPGGRWLRFYAADIGRGPDGAWWVLGDRAQAPSGAGYALENRMILSRALPSLYRDMNVERLAPFFREFRASISGAAQRVDPRICLLTPGPWSETYSEQVNLARYLGLTAGRRRRSRHERWQAACAHHRRLEARRCDLASRRRRLVRSAGAERRVAAGRRRVCSRRSVSGAVVVANMPGAGLVESRALMSFLPELSQRLLGENLDSPMSRRGGADAKASAIRLSTP